MKPDVKSEILLIFEEMHGAESPHGEALANPLVFALRDVQRKYGDLTVESLQEVILETKYEYAGICSILFLDSMRTSIPFLKDVIVGNDNSEYVDAVINSLGDLEAVEALHEVYKNVPGEVRERVGIEIIFIEADLPKRNSSVI